MRLGVHRPDFPPRKNSSGAPEYGNRVREPINCDKYRSNFVTLPRILIDSARL
jgi:hypothetical protein